jgi:hypothetical protein
MASSKSIEVARGGQALYDERLRSELEATNADKFVAIEPDFGDYFLGNTLSEAIQSARSAYPNRLPFAVRIGHDATVELGVLCP